MARIGPLGSGLFGRFFERACCRSSVVEHSIGNGEVDSSILSGSTIFCKVARDGLLAAAFGARVDLDKNAPLFNRKPPSRCTGLQDLAHHHQAGSVPSQRRNDG
jgi:hypothetical protein